MLQNKTLEQRVADLEKEVKIKTEFAEEETEKSKAINRGLKDKHYTKGEENAIVRKALMHLIDKYGCQNDAELQEFMTYFNAVEEIKAEVLESEER